MLIRFGFNNGEALDRDDYVVGFHILDENGFSISFHNSAQMGFLIAKGTREVTCRIDNLPLSRQRFYIKPFLTLLGSNPVDSWDKELSFDVVSCIPHPQGEGYERRHGCVFIPHAWGAGG